MIGNAFALLSLVDNVFQDADNDNINFLIFRNLYSLEIIFIERLQKNNPKDSVNIDKI